MLYHPRKKRMNVEQEDENRREREGGVAVVKDFGKKYLEIGEEFDRKAVKVP